jgi:nucleoside-diphosphate-sugar epimerase
MSAFRDRGPNRYGRGRIFYVSRCINDGGRPGALNVLPAIGVYAAIRREKGEPFGFPGGPSFVWEAADADLVADAMVWAAQSPQAANEAFNITNEMSGTRSLRSTTFARGTCGSWLAKGTSTRTSPSPTAPRKDPGPS